MIRANRFARIALPIACATKSWFKDVGVAPQCANLGGFGALRAERDCFCDFLAIVCETCSETCNFQARKTNPNPNSLVRMFSGGVGVFHLKGWGPKSSVCPSKRRKTKLFAGISRGHPKNLRKIIFALNSCPLNLHFAI